MLASKAYNMDGEQVAALLYKKADDETLTEDLREDAETVLLDLNAKRIAQLKAEKKEAFDKAFGEAMGKTSEKYESLIRENFGIDPDKTLKGEELVKAVKTATANTKLNPDDVKNSQPFLEAEKHWQQKEAAINAAWEEKWKAKEREVEREKTWSEVRKEIAGTVAKTPNLNPEAVTPLMVELFASKYQGYDFQREGEEFYPLKDGKRVENEQGYAVTLRQLVEADARQVFPTIAQTAAGNSGNQPGGSKTVTTPFKDGDDFTAQYNAAKPSERAKLAAAWKMQKEQAGKG